MNSNARFDAMVNVAVNVDGCSVRQLNVWVDIWTES